MSCTVYQYLGERLSNNGLEVYYSEPDNIYKEDFDCSLLAQTLQLDFTTFKLTELELLSSSNLSTWLQYCAKKAGDEPDILGVKIFRFLTGEGFDDFISDVTQTFTDLLNGNATGAFQSFIKQKDPDVRAKLEIARSWLSSIYEEYYGQKYLIQVGNSDIGVCIKDRYGNAPSGNVKVEADGGIFYSSDTPSTAGGWLSKNQNQLMGLSVGTELNSFTETDGRIGCFVKFDQANQIEKYGLIWNIDLSKLGDDNFFKKSNESDIYLKASVEPILYQIDDKQYVLVNLSSRAELKIAPGTEDCPGLLESVGAVAIMVLHGTDGPDDFKASLSNMLCGDDDGTKTGTSLTHSNLNNFNMSPIAISPDSFCIPFKSNLFTYGPWFYQSNPVGLTQIETNKELAPWNFANLQNTGYDIMNYYGNLIAQDGPRALQKQESGSITVASLPSYGIGYIVGSNAATLTDLQINIGDNGYTTVYNFQTYAPKFGQPGRYLSDLWSRNYKSMSYLHKFMKEENLKLKNLMNRTSSEIQKEKSIRKSIPITSGDVNTVGVPAGTPGTNSDRTPHMMLFGGYVMRDKETTLGGGEECVEVSSEYPQNCNCNSQIPPSVPIPVSVGSLGNNLVNIPQVVTESDMSNLWYKERANNFQRLSITTLDLLFASISTNQQDDPDAELPRLALYQNYDCGYSEFSSKTPTFLGDGKAPNSRTRFEIPPFHFDDILQYDLPINQMYLNSVTSSAMLDNWDGRKNASTQGFVTNIIAYGALSENFDIDQSEESRDKQQGETNFRYSILRGPLTLQSWGYDTSGKPIPNAIDAADQAEKGRFRRRGLQDKFLKDWLSNPKTWPAGPIDLRWDRERGMWVSPPSNKIVVARLLTNLERFGVAEAELIDPEAGGIRFYEEYDIWSQQGANIKGSIHRAKIKVYDFLGIKLCKCDYIYAYYDDNRYIVLESNRAYKDPNESCCATTGTVPTPTKVTQPTQPTQPTPTSCWCNLECLKTLSNFKAGKHQALVHKQESNGPDCLVWEDIVECYTTPPNFYQNP
jgi:hypothetical protein